MNRYIILVPVFFSCCLCVFSQEKLHITGNEKPVRTFNDLNLSMDITSRSLPDKHKIGITFRVNGENEDYLFYLFSDPFHSEGFNGMNLEYDMLRIWVNQNNGLKEPILGDPRVATAQFSFRGKFSEYDEYLLNRTEWKKEGYFKFGTQSDENFDSYAITGNVNAGADITIKYHFLVTRKSWKDEYLLGITDPIKYTIPHKVLSDLLVEEKESESLATSEPEAVLTPEETVKQVAETGAAEKPVQEEIKSEPAVERKKTEEVQRKDDVSRKESRDNCAEYRKRINNIHNQTEDLFKELRKSEESIGDGLSVLRDEVVKCELVKCYQDIKSQFDRNGWTKNIEGIEYRINRLNRDYSSLAKSEDFRKCNIDASGLEDLIEECYIIRQGIEKELVAFVYYLEKYIIDRDPFDETLKAFKDDVNKISVSYKYINDLYDKYDDKYFNKGKLERSDIAVLEQAIKSIDSLKTAVDSTIIKAEKYYEDRTASGKFPEATFKRETQFSVSLADCSNLKRKIQDLLDDAKDELTGIGVIIFIGIIALILLLSVYYYIGIVRKKVSNRNTRTYSGPASTASNGSDKDPSDDGGIEILEDDDEKFKGKGLDTVKKLVGIKYFEIDVQSLLSNTAVRKLYLCNDFIIKAYRYFEDKILSIGDGDIDDLYEYGGFIIGNWDYSAYGDDQYELSLEYFIEPGDDAKFSKFNIDFGYTISFNMEELIINLATAGNDQVFVGWLHSHPGHNVFLSNYDIEVQERFRNQYHPNRHVALVLEPTTPKWDLGLFTFKKSGEMNNKEELLSLLSFHELYSWAMGENREKPSGQHFEFYLTDTKNISFDRSILMQLKIFVERELAKQGTESQCYNLFGTKTGEAGKNDHFHLVKMEQNHVKSNAKLEWIGLFFAVPDGDQIPDMLSRYQKEVLSYSFSVVLVYNIRKSMFAIIPLSSDGQIEDGIKWTEFSKNEMLPFLSK